MAKKQLCAIDIGSNKICAVIANIEDISKITVMGAATQASSGIKKGVVVDIDEASESISSCLKSAERMAGTTVSRAIISISGSHISSVNYKGIIGISRDEITSEDIARATDSAKSVAVPLNKDILQTFPREFIIDSQGGIKDPIGMSGMRLEVDTHIISGSSSTIKNIEKCLDEVSVKVDEIFFAGWAGSEVCVNSTERELGALYLDIGGGTTDICIYQDDSIYFSASVDFGGNNITSDLAIGLRISIADAERVKCDVMQLIKNAQVRKLKNSQDENNPEYNNSDELIFDLSDLGINGTTTKEFFDEIVDARIEEIIESIKKIIIDADIEFKFPAGVILSGGSSKLAGIAEYVGKYIDAPIRVATPPMLYGLSDEINSPNFSAVNGMISYYAKRGGISSKESTKRGGTSNNFINKLKSLLGNITT